MGFRPEALFAAFKVAGMLTQAIYRPGSGTPTTFSCGYTQPETLVLGEQQQAAEYLIEYETAAVARIREGDPIQVTTPHGDQLFRALAHATTVGDGYFSKCRLERA